MATSTGTLGEDIQSNRLVPRVEETLKLSIDHANGLVRSDGHWCGEFQMDVTSTSEYIMLRYALGLDIQTDKEAYCQYILSKQDDYGSWGTAPQIPGDVSVSVEAYLALKILDFEPSHEVMEKAREFILKSGGVEKVRMFTRIYLAMFGLFPWTAVPELPVELILVPSAFPINIYSFACWARATMAPLSIICHHKPVYSLPNGQSPNNEYLDELWLNANTKTVHYGLPLSTLFMNGNLSGFAFSCLDKLCYQLNGLRTIPFLRTYARRKCLEWILERQESTGDSGGLFPIMHANVLAFALEGYKLDDSPVKLGIQAIENFCWQDEHGKRVQACVTPVWDTALMSIGLSDAMSPDNHVIERAISWLRNRQLIIPYGDWCVNRPSLPPGGFSIQYQNTWYPDVDDVAVVILALVKHDATSTGSSSVMAAATWIKGMQNSDGGWAAFDVENNKLFLNTIPFSDMDSLCDTSCPDITGHVLEAFGLMTKRAPENHYFATLQAASARGIQYLASTQERNGSWFGRWGCNYVYGTSNALCGLAYYPHDSRVPVMVQRGLQWLKSKQQADGGWGESVLSYQAASQDQQNSTPSQTGWALMGLLAHLAPEDPAIKQGIQYLVMTLQPGKGIGSSWTEAVYTGTGFPNYSYIGYTYYRHYFPMMALGRYLQKARGNLA